MCCGLRSVRATVGPIKPVLRSGYQNPAEIAKRAPDEPRRKDLGCQQSRRLAVLGIPALLKVDGKEKETEMFWSVDEPAQTRQLPVVVVELLFCRVKALIHHRL